MLLQGFNSNRVTVQAYCKAIFQQYFFNTFVQSGQKRLTGRSCALGLFPHLLLMCLLTPCFVVARMRGRCDTRPHPHITAHAELWFAGFYAEKPVITRHNLTQSDCNYLDMLWLHLKGLEWEEYSKEKCVKEGCKGTRRELLWQFQLLYLRIKPAKGINFYHFLVSIVCFSAAL